MGSLCSKHDRNKDEIELPARPVTVTEVAARTAVLLERRATQSTAQPAVALSPTLDPPPVLPPKPPPQAHIQQTLRLSRLETDLISDSLRVGTVDLPTVSKSFEPYHVVFERKNTPTTATPNKATAGTRHGEGSTSPTAWQRQIGLGTGQETGNSPEISPLSPQQSKAELDPLVESTPTTNSRSHGKQQELKKTLDSGQKEAVQAEPTPWPSPQSHGKDEKPKKRRVSGIIESTSSPPTPKGLDETKYHKTSPPTKTWGNEFPTSVGGNGQPARMDRGRVWPSTFTSKELSGHGDAVFAVDFTADGSRLVSGSTDKSIRIWDLSTGSLQKSIELHFDTVRDVAVSPTADTLASASLDQTVRLWDLATPVPPLRTFLARASASSVAFSPDGSRLAAGAQDNVVRLWDVSTGDLTLELHGHEGAIASVALSKDDRYIASGSLDMTVRMWDLSGKLVATLDDHIGCVHAVAFSPGSSRLATGSADKTVILWDTNPGTPIKKLRSLRGHTDLVWSVAFTREGDVVASGSADKTIVLWQVATGRKLHVLRGHQDAVFCVAFSPVANVFASASRDKMIRVWDGRETNAMAKER